MATLIVDNLRVEIARGGQAVGDVAIAPLAGGSIVNLVIPDATGIAVALRALCGARTVGDAGYEVTIDGSPIADATWDGAIYLGPYVRHTFSGRATTVEEEVLTSVLDNDEAPELHLRTVRFLLGMFHLDHLAASRPDALSGGEAQRLALLLALVNRNRPIIIDHALSEQDARHARLLAIFLARFAALLEVPILHRRAATDLREAVPCQSGHESHEPVLTAADVRVLAGRQLICEIPALVVERGSVTLVAGENGSGKSLLCRLLIKELPSGVRSKARLQWQGGHPPSQAYVSQDVTLGFSFPTVEAELAAASNDALEAFRGAPTVRHSDLEVSPFELTTDKQKLVAVIKALMVGREMVILDEPSEYWDDSQYSYMNGLFEQFAKADNTLIIATHDARLLTSEYRRLELSIPKSRRLQIPAKAPLPVRQATLAGKEYMYRAWRVLHDLWPNSTLELFENWHSNVDGVLLQQIKHIADCPRAMTLLDLGCGNGLQTLWLRSQLLASNVEVVRTVGLEWQDHAIEWANYWAAQIDAVDFRVADIDVALETSEIQGSFNLISSLFVMHDLPNVQAHIQQVTHALPRQGAYLSCILNPLWVETRKVELFGDNADLPIPHDADFARDYRLPESTGEVLGLPYFHRSVERYHEIFQAAGFRKVITAFSDGGAGASENEPTVPQTVSFLAFKD